MGPFILHQPPMTDAYERARQAALDARDLVAAIECRLWTVEPLLFRAARIARGVRADRIEQWTDWELRGYNPADAEALDMMDQTLRRTGEDTAHALCAPLPVLEARLASMHDEERRIDPNTGAHRLDALRREAARLVAIRSAALAMLHAFATQVFSDRAHLLELHERRIVLPPFPPLAGGHGSEADAVDVSACLAALDSFIDDADREPPAAPPAADALDEEEAEVLLEDEEDGEVLVDADEGDDDPEPKDIAPLEEYGSDDSGASPLADEREDDSEPEADAAADTELPVALLESDEAEVEAQEAADDHEPAEWEKIVQDAKRPAIGAAVADILLTDDDIDAIFAATEEDIADFDGGDGGESSANTENSADASSGAAAEPDDTELARSALAADPFSHVDPEQRAAVERFAMAADSRAVGSVRAAEAALHHRAPNAAAEALQAQRHLIDAIADRVLPPSNEDLVVDHVRLPNEPAKPFCRLFAWLRLCIADADAARPLRYALFHHYRRLDPDFFRPADAEEAEALIDRTFALLYRTLGWMAPEQQAEFAR